ncbi:Seryl-tRNA synthetase [Chytridium lagenaria]|nr:Seryl-tRNA synthetase [Chytridium lagenaria]
MEEDLYEEARHIPNDSSPDVPVGDESKSITVDMVGARRMQDEARTLKDHIELAKLHNLADFDRAGKVSGSGFYFLKNAGVLLEMALIRYALDFCISKGFQPISVPDVIRHEVIEACGFNPKSSDPQTYFLETHLDAPRQKGYDPMRLCLSATAEFPLAAMHSNEVFLASALPLKMVAFGRAFRAEGLAGAVNRGLYRVHQFSKVEMFALTDKNGSESMLEEFREIQKQIFEGLELSFRVLNMSSEELGAPAYKKYDMEAWMPARNDWGEISSSSNCTDYQARRFNIRYFDRSTGATPHQSAEFVHSVNGTAAAIPRLIISILETHQLENGDIIIPKKLRKYLYGEDVDRIRVPE